MMSRTYGGRQRRPRRRLRSVIALLLRSRSLRPVDCRFVLPFLTRMQSELVDVARLGVQEETLLGEGKKDWLGGARICRWALLVQRMLGGQLDVAEEVIGCLVVDKEGTLHCVCGLRARDWHRGKKVKRLLHPRCPRLWSISSRAGLCCAASYETKPRRSSANLDRFPPPRWHDEDAVLTSAKATEVSAAAAEANNHDQALARSWLRSERQPDVGVELDVQDGAVRTS